MIERGGGGQRHRQRKKQAPCGELNAGPDPRTPGSHPGPKAGAELLNHPEKNSLPKGTVSAILFCPTELEHRHPHL